MFKKKPQIKNLSPLRSSDRRKLADQIIADYQVIVPSDQEQENASDASPAPTLSSIRSSLLPDNLQSARFTTLAGATATLVSGTVYVGSHPGLEERILWIQYGKEVRLYPTVYTLWQNPGLVPLLHTPDFVIEKLQTGADLMTPGLFGGPPWPERASPGAVVAVAGMQNDTVPVWVGTCKIDVSALGRVQGMKGAAVEGIHWKGDELWTWSQSGVGGRAAPTAIEGWSGLASRLATGIEDADLDDDEEDAAQEEGGVSLVAPLEEEHTENETQQPNGDTEHVPTTPEVDAAFKEAFLFSVVSAKKSGSPPPRYGIDFPIGQAGVIDKMIKPFLRYDSPHYTIKNTSSSGETRIYDIDFDDQQVLVFTPYSLPTPKTAAAKPPNDSKTSNGTHASDVRLVTLFRPSPKLYPDLFPSKHGFYSGAQVSQTLKTYITANPELSQGTSSKRHIKLNPFIANTILNGSSSEDNAILAAGEIGRDVLSRRISDDTILMAPHWVLLQPPASKEYNPADPAATLSAHNIKPKPYPPPSVLITIEKRTGTKTVTRISGFETFGLNPQTLAPELQKKCAGSASIGQLMGGKPGTMEITVQGDQTDIVRSELVKRGVHTEWVQVDDKTKKKKKGAQPGR
ncbi:Translation machinery-associated protein 64 [Cyphellophora attinorum]|uniref:Translation machinery-associated protein 64 n=1 Tax=Cyphellophora attinorum TaxID=1664694 RepID=A0A0N1H4S2_9EURO|nr:Translation machinery-associated protein 64 [Phialophora attinorum]KPI36447.1 Translation machinery-associated protein 64 [Phialophora attinorum]